MPSIPIIQFTICNISIGEFSQNVPDNPPSGTIYLQDNLAHCAPSGGLYFISIKGICLLDRGTIIRSAKEHIEL